MVRKLDLMIMSGVDDGKLLTFRTQNGDGALSPAPNTADLVWALQIGRSETMDICLRFDTFSSRQHARLILRDGVWLLEDCKSKNGTFLAADGGLSDSPADPLAHTLGGDWEGDEVQVIGIVPLAVGQLFRVGRTWLRIQPSGLPYSESD